MYAYALCKCPRQPCLFLATWPKSHWLAFEDGPLPGVDDDATIYVREVE